MDIEKIVKEITSEYHTNNPFNLAEKFNILVSFEKLGTLNGYYNNVFDVKSIHINSGLSERDRKITCAHELGHSVLHPALNASFMSSNTFMVKGKYEKQANLFASYLLVPTICLEDYPGLSIDELARATDMPTELLKIRLNF